MSLQSTGFFCTATVVDAAGNKSTLRFDVVGADIATAKTNAATIIAALAAITDGTIVTYTIGEKFQEDTDFYGAANSEVENIAQVVVQLEVGSGDPIKYHNLKIPAPVAALFVGTSGPNRNLVDTTYANLITYVELFTDKTGYGTPGDDAIALVSDGEKVEPDNTNEVPVIVSGKRIHRASTKG